MNTDYYMYYMSYLYSMYNGYPFVFRMTLVMVIFLSALVIFGIIRLLRIGYRIYRYEKRYERMETRYKEKFHYIITQEKTYSVAAVQQLLDFTANKSENWQREIITDVLIAVREQIKDDDSLNFTNYRHCLEVFGLAQFWEKRIKAGDSIKRKVALQKMASLDAGLNVGLLSKSIYHSDKHLRKAARSIYTDQEDYHPFRFMEENFDESFDQLDKVRLHASLVKRSKEGGLPNLLRWITTSKNNKYIAFIIREIGFFNQQECAPNLVRLLDVHENRKVRAQIVYTLGTLGYDAAVPTLMVRYVLESNRVRQAIIETLGIIKSDNSLQFLLESYENTEDNYFKITIVRAIKQYGEEGKQALNRLSAEGGVEEETIINQVFAENSLLTF
ncbi:HEAT repeat domain-containing protein [Sphingobacterium corticis]|uniref:HEAT repeat domain-containing protein n=1 Tax=Sphingobacterium corticis TaxID=1812823 RepID=A0ABW5NGL5_9SPHI